MHCNGCGTYVPAIAVVGDAPDYESSTAQLCRPCVEDALAAFDCREHEDCAIAPATLGRACAAERYAAPEIRSTTKEESNG